MNYKKIYDTLIHKRKQNPPIGYIENHHIVMRSMGGSNNKENLVKLTGREHWIAHLLLYKIHRNDKTAHACNMMSMRCEERGIPFVKNSRMYEKIRIRCAKLMSAKNKISHKGKNNSQYDTRWICNLSLKENKKIQSSMTIPDGWVAGRNKWKVKNKNSLRKRLDKRISITNGQNVKRIVYYDQLPIPDGWWEGSYPCSDETKFKIKIAMLDTLSRHV